MSLKRRAMGLLMALVLLLAMLPLAGVATADDPIVVACVGDSLTVGYASTNNKTYPNRMQALLGNAYRVHNFGVNGSTAATNATFNGDPSGYALLDNFAASKAVEPDVVIVMLGSNDTKTENWRNGANAQRYEDDLRALIEAYQALPSEPLVIVGLSPVIGEGGAFGDTATVNQLIRTQINAIQRKVAEALSLPIVDAYAATEGKPELFEKDAENSGGDGIHFNNTGYGVLAEVFGEAVLTYAAGENDTSIIKFTLAGEEGGVNKTENTVRVTVPHSSSFMMTPEIIVPQGATVSPSGEQDFSKPITYTVTARDGVTTQAYTVYASMGPRVKVACIGDSLTAGGFPTDLQTLLGESYEVKNFGVNSTTVCKNGLKETDDGRGAYIYHSAYTQSKEYLPDVVFILLGANDSKEAGNNPDWVTNWTAENKAAFKDDLKELALSYMDLPTKPLVIFGLPTKPNSNAWGVSASNVVNDIIPRIREVAEELGRPCIDLYTLFDGHSEWLGGDQLHPNAEGNKQIAKAYADVLLPLKLNVAAVPAALSMLKFPSFNDVTQGEELRLAACSVGLHYSNGAISEKTITVDMLSGLDMDVLGTQTVTVTYLGFTTEMELLVHGIGDANDDYKINTTDARMILQYAADMDVMIYEELADTDGNGTVNTTDARRVLQFSAGLLEKLY